MKRYFGVVLCLVFLMPLLVSGQTIVKISQFPNTNTLTSTNLFVVTVGQTNMNISYAQLSNLLATAIGTGTGSGTSTSNSIPGNGVYVGTNFICDTGATNLWRIVLTKNSGIMLTNGIDGQTMTIQVTQDGTGGWGLVTNQVGTCGSWNFGTDITGWSITTNAGRTDYIRCSYWKVSNRWDVVGYVRGY